MCKITWAPLISLIGGAPLGSEMAFGYPPEGIFSYNGFFANDSNYVHYQNEIKKRNIPYEILDENFEDRHIDLLICTPPCAGLSMLNTSKNVEKKGHGCKQNEWMYQCAIDGIERFTANVIIIENAPALYTSKGEKVAADLIKIAKDRNYSISFYKTSTEFHGIPQKRIRTFALLWKSDSAPVMEYYKRESLNFKEFLDTISKDAPQFNEIINPKLLNDVYFNFIKAKYNQDPREIVNTTTCFNFINKNNLLQECLEWATKEGLNTRLIEHALKKFSDGLEIWDGSVHLAKDKMASCIGRNMNDTIHPTEDRSLNIREAISLMGMPEDFILLNPKKFYQIAQNVPSCTARDITLEAIKFLNGELQDSGSSVIKQDNIKERIDYKEEVNFKPLDI